MAVGPVPAPVGYLDRVADADAGNPGPFDRGTALDRLAAEHFDLLVIGGGVTGCGVALDAAARGLRTALVEGGDFASGTSSKSSKLVHGGLRYLQQHDYLLVYEALHERQRLIRNAPHLVHPLPFLIPLFGRDGMVAESVAKAYSTVLWLYDVSGGVRIGTATAGSAGPRPSTTSRSCAPTAWSPRSSTGTPRPTTPASPSPWPAPQRPGGRCWPTTRRSRR